MARSIRIGNSKPGKDAIIEDLSLKQKTPRKKKVAIPVKKQTELKLIKAISGQSMVI